MRKQVSRTRRMLRVVARVALCGVAAAGLTMSQPHPAKADPGGEEKVTICHIPPGNPENRHEITVGASAVPAHILNHGDHVGSCTPGA
jgi:hypothetical protein